VSNIECPGTTGLTGSSFPDACDREAKPVLPMQERHTIITVAGHKNGFEIGEAAFGDHNTLPGSQVLNLDAIVCQPSGNKGSSTSMTRPCCSFSTCNAGIQQ
jgi:hypothetical protein